MIKQCELTITYGDIAKLYHRFGHTNNTMRLTGGYWSGLTSGHRKCCVCNDLEVLQDNAAIHASRHMVSVAGDDELNLQVRM